MGFETKNKKIYIWSIVYMLVVFVFSEFVTSYSLITWGMYLVLALPFYICLDKFLMICLILSTLSDYFSGVGEGIMGLYSILLILILINIFFSNRKFTVKGQLFPVLLILCVWISYFHSPFDFIDGAYSMTYAIIISIMIMGLIKVDNDTLSDFLPVLTVVTVAFFLLVLVLHGTVFGIMISINAEINHNAFGRCLAQLSAILAVRVLSTREKKIIFLIPWVITIGLTLMTGSRNAFLAEVVSIIFVYIMIQRQKNNRISKTVIALIVIVLLIVITYMFFPYFGLDLGRYDYIELAQTGGTNRATIWRRLIPLLITNYLLFGYGPGYSCSASIVSGLVHRGYTNTHNLFIEVWGELGLVGLFCFVSLVIASFREAYAKLKNNSTILYVLALYVEIITNGIGEAEFASMSLWIIIALCYSVRSEQKVRV